MQRMTRRCTWPPSELLAMACRAMHRACALRPNAVHGLVSCGTSCMRPFVVNVVCCQLGCQFGFTCRYGHTTVMEALLRHGAKTGAKNKQVRCSSQQATTLWNTCSSSCRKAGLPRRGHAVAVHGSIHTACMGVFSACCLLAHLCLQGLTAMACALVGGHVAAAKLLQG